jgi:hypothetical protein
MASKQLRQKYWRTKNCINTENIHKYLQQQIKQNLLQKIIKILALA